MRNKLINIKNEAEKIIESKIELNKEIETKRKICEIFINNIDGIKLNQFKKIKDTIEENFNEEKISVYYVREGFRNDTYKICFSFYNFRHRERYSSIWIKSNERISKEEFEEHLKRCGTIIKIPTLKQVMKNLERTKKESLKIFNQFEKFKMNKSITGIDKDEYFNRFINECSNTYNKLKVS